MWGFVILSALKIWLERRWPTSLAATLASYACLVLFLIWFGSEAWAGYQRRRPHWSRESWRRYLRLAAMPVVAIVLLFIELAFLDPKGTGIFGAPKSMLRIVWMGIDLMLMGFGAIGLSSAVDWLRDGEPSEPFTRTRWFQRRRRAAAN